MAPIVTRGWAKRGCTPSVYQRTRSHEKVSVIAAICVSPDRKRVKLFFALYQKHNINSTTICEFLKQLKRHIRAHIMLVWDRLKAHISKQTKKFFGKHVRIHPILLPPYAPELNPVECFWSYLKTKPLANFAPEDIENLYKAALHAGRSVQRKEILLRSFIKHSGLPLRLI